MSFVVLHTLEGKATEIKEYSIGADAFGRGQDFDSRTDSVVRVVARRVRERLAGFYRDEGKRDPIVIKLSPGSYIPSFVSREQADCASPVSPPASLISPGPVSPAPISPDQGLAGTTISHYELLELIARGSSGLVYRAEDLRLKRGVAIKVLSRDFSSDSQGLERFLDEARAASAVNHPNICAIYDVGQHEDRAYIVMELAEGKTLDAFIAEGPLSVDTVLDLSIEICDALQTAHMCGIVHRDVRSANIVVNSRGHAKLLDFSSAQAITGRARTVRSPHTTLSSIAVESPTPSEPKPEAASQERADILGIGAILYEMATGRKPARAGVLSARAGNPGLPVELDVLICKVLAGDGTIAGISDVREELLRIQHSRQLESLSVPRVRKWPLWGVSALGLAVLAGLFSVYLFKPPQPHIAKYSQLTRDGQGKIIPFSSTTQGALVADSTRIYFSEISGTEVKLTQVATTGGETIPLQTGAERPLVIKDISPDNSKLLVMDFYRPAPDLPLYILPLHILPLPGGAIHPLGSVIGHDGSWSADVSHLAYANGDDLYLADADGRNPRKLVHCPGVPFWPRFSPDGTVLRFTVQDGDGNTSLWEVSSQGANLHPILRAESGERSSDCCGSWSPNGRFFVFQSARNGRPNIWLIPAENRFLKRPAAPLQLTNGPLSLSAPVFSRDGKQIFAIAVQRRGELMRYDADRKNFSAYLSGISADHVEFSPDRASVVYSSYPDGIIWRARVDGTERIQLSPPGVNAWFPRWSPDAKQIAFMGSQRGGPVKIYVVSSGGGDAELLLPGPTSQIDPNWSRDGKSLLFAVVPSATGLGAGPSEIQSLNLETHRLSTLPGSEGLCTPRWSPDGRFVVATALSQNKWRDPGVVIFDFETGAWKALERDPIDNKWFSADGQYYYFDKYVGDDPAIFRIRMSDRKLERVVSLRGIRRAQGTMGWWMGLTPDGSPMILRDTSIEEIYALDFRDR